MAVGGVKEHNVAEVAAHGARCVRLVSDAADAEDIPVNIEAIKAHLHGLASLPEAFTASIVTDYAREVGLCTLRTNNERNTAPNETLESESRRYGAAF